MGEADGMRLICALMQGPETVFRIIEREQIECEATRNGTLHLAHTPKGMKDLKDRLRQSKISGASLELLDADEARRRTGSNAFHGALLDPGAGTVQPLAYCHGLARAAQRVGATLNTQSPVQNLRQDNGMWVLGCNGATIRARMVLNATNAYTHAGAKPPNAQFAIVNYCQFATAPLSPDQLQHVLPGREGCWDTALVMSSIRVDQAGRLIIGGMGNGDGPGGAIHKGWARRKLRALYPDLADVAFEYGWSGRIAMTGDHVPKVEAFGPNALTVFGYSGRGISPGTVLGTAAAQALLNNDNSSLPIPVTSGYVERFSSAKTVYYESGATLMHALPVGR